MSAAHPSLARIPPGYALPGALSANALKSQ